MLICLLAETRIEFEIYAIPDGEGDYGFASVAIEASGSAVKDTYCRF